MKGFYTSNREELYDISNKSIAAFKFNMNNIDTWRNVDSSKRENEVKRILEEP